MTLSDYRYITEFIQDNKYVTKIGGSYHLNIQTDKGMMYSANIIIEKNTLINKIFLERCFGHIEGNIIAILVDYSIPKKWETPLWKALNDS